VPMPPPPPPVLPALEVTPSYHHIGNAHERCLALSRQVGVAELEAALAFPREEMFVRAATEHAQSAIELGRAMQRAVAASSTKKRKPGRPKKSVAAETVGRASPITPELSADAAATLAGATTADANKPPRRRGARDEPYVPSCVVCQPGYLFRSSRLALRSQVRMPICGLRQDVQEKLTPEGTYPTPHGRETFPV
jgi:hypothetical protein